MELYEQNKAALMQVSAGMGQWLEDGVEEDWIEQREKQLYIKFQGHIIPVYNNTDDPTIEIDQALTQLNLFKENVTLIIGVGLGHSTNRVLEKMEEGHHVIIIEPIPCLIRKAFRMYDFSKALKDRTLLICPTKQEIGTIFSWLENVKVIQDWGLIVDKTAQIRSEYAIPLSYAVELMNQIQCNVGTVSTAGAQIADNDIATLPYVIRHRGVAELINLYKGKPAICVATGPSLERNIHLLKQVYEDESAIIIAVGQAMRPLLAYGIRPDFMCTVDFGEVNMTHFAGLCDQDIPLVTINKAYAPLLKTYKGPKFISATVEGGFEESAHALLSEKGALAQGGSVIHMTFGLACALGCDPIMLIGHNLALTDRSHFALADSGGTVKVDENGTIKWQIHDPRSTLLHNREDITMGDQKYIRGYYGDTVLTNTGLLTFLTAMENLVEQYPGTAINCTEGGAYINGFKRMFLHDALDKYCKEHIDKSVIQPLLSLADDADALCEKAITLLHNDIDLLNAIIENAENGLRTVKKLRDTRDPVKLFKILEKNAKYSERTHQAAKKLPTISLAIYWASRRIQSRELNVEGDVHKLIYEKNRKELNIRLDRNELILTAARDAAVKIKNTYDATYALIKQYHDTHNTCLDPTGELAPPSVADAEDYFSVGNFARPLLEAERILNDASMNHTIYNEAAYDVALKARRMRAQRIKEAEEQQARDYAARLNLVPQYLDLISESKKIGREQRDFTKALELIQQAIDMFPNREEARWGMASALYLAGRIQESLDYYYDLIQRFPDNMRYRLEIGRILLAHDNEDGFKYFKDAIDSSDEYLGYLGELALYYQKYHHHQEALEAGRKHLENNPFDSDIKNLVEYLTQEQ